MTTATTATNALTIPTGYNFRLFRSDFYGGIVVCEVFEESSGCGFIFPVPGCLDQETIDAAINELVNPEPLSPSRK